MNPKSPKSEMFLPDLPQEILADIFSRLPTKSAGACRCLSITWNRYLSSQNFIKLHLINRPYQENLIVLGADCSLRLITPPIKSNAMSKTLELQNIFSRRHKVRNGSWKQVVGCCNGLVLLLNEKERMSLVNPITKQMVYIPNPPPIKKNRADKLGHGFGCDSSNGDCKIVVLDSIETDTFVHVYSVETSLWRQLEVSPYDHNSPHSYFGAFVNGALHWMVSSKIPPYIPIIAAFDLAREAFFEIPTPSKANKEHMLLCGLFVLGRCLCLVDVRTRSRFIDLWIMLDYGVSDSWTKLSVDRCHGYVSDMRPLCIDVESQNIVWVNYLFGFFISNWKKERTRVMFIDGNFDSIRHSYVDGGMFEETLVSPMGIQGEQGAT